MSEARVWDIGDPEPNDCDQVQSDFMVHGSWESWNIAFRRTAHGHWKADANVINEYWPWDQVVRRFGPVQEIQ